MLDARAAAGRSMARKDVRVRERWQPVSRGRRYLLARGAAVRERCVRAEARS